MRSAASVTQNSLYEVMPENVLLQFKRTLADCLRWAESQMVDEADKIEAAAWVARPTFRERLIGALRVPRWAIGATAVTAAAAVAWVITTRDGLFSRDPNQVATQVAEVRELTLPDGSQVTVGAQSKLEYAFTPDARRVTMDDGDAFFSVTKDAARPFFVVIDGVQIKAVGTQFEVRERAEGVSVAVVEGDVEVSRPDSGEAEIVSLHRGETVIADYAAVDPVRNVSPDDVGAWRAGRLVYDNVELRDVVADANRYINAKITIQDAELATERITTSFRTTQVEGMLETLQSALPLSADRQINGDIVLHTRR